MTSAMLRSDYRYIIPPVEDLGLCDDPEQPVPGVEEYLRACRQKDQKPLKRAQPRIHRAVVAPASHPLAGQLIAPPALVTQSNHMKSENRPVACRGAPKCDRWFRDSYDMMFHARVEHPRLLSPLEMEKYKPKF